MAKSILKIHTQNGDIPVGYPGLADKPIADKTLSEEGAFADSKAVGDKFKETKAETDSLKEDKADKTALVKTDRKLDALWKLNQGISYEFQTDDTEAYQKTIPTGAKVASVKSIGGKTIVWNQLNLNKENSITRGGISFTNNKDGSWTITGTCSAPDGNSANTLIYLFSKNLYQVINICLKLINILVKIMVLQLMALLSH